MAICIIESCGDHIHAKGFCEKHYRRYKRNGHPGRVVREYETHNKTRTQIYHVWGAMINRCYKPKNKYYHRYGGRGINVCKEWKSSFLSFYKDMGDIPFKGAQIDRRNNNGNYEPSNCRWVTPKENTNNRSF